MRGELCSEAIRLGRILCELLPGEHAPRGESLSEPPGEPLGLLALMLLHDSRGAARTNADGDLVLLEDQDRSLWNRLQMEEGLALAASAMRAAERGPYTLQAAIAAEHARAPRSADTDWRTIAGLYDALLRVRPTPVIELNRAVALAMTYGPLAGLNEIARLKTSHELDSYYLFWSGRPICSAGSAAASKRNRPIATHSNSSRRTRSEGFSNAASRSCSFSPLPAIAG